MSFEQEREFEAELRKLKPRQPGLNLEKRLEEAIHKADRRKRLILFRSYAGWGGFAAAASILVVFGLSLFNQDLKPGEEALAETTEIVDPLQVERVDVDRNSFKPVLAQNNLRERVDEGIVFLRNGMTARKYRYEFVDRVVWRNPSDGAVIEMEVPRDEVILIPVQTF